MIEERDLIYTSNIDCLIGETINKIDVNRFSAKDKDNDSIIFHTNSGYSLEMYHNQDCCESVTIDDIIGDLDDLLNSPILIAEMNTNKSEANGDSETWTFYKLATIKGYVDIKWYGTSNGFYSEEVYIDITKQNL